MRITQRVLLKDGKIIDVSGNKITLEYKGKRYYKLHSRIRNCVDIYDENWNELPKY